MVGVLVGALIILVGVLAGVAMVSEKEETQ